MAGDTQITIAGNLVDDPQLRYTPTGQAVANFRVASTPRFRDNATGEWKYGDTPSKRTSETLKLSRYMCLPHRCHRSRGAWLTGAQLPAYHQP